LEKDVIGNTISRYCLSEQLLLDYKSNEHTLNFSTCKNCYKYLPLSLHKGTGISSVISRPQTAYNEDRL